MAGEIVANGKGERDCGFIRPLAWADQENLRMRILHNIIKMTLLISSHKKVILFLIDL
ncbi:hypothetical protein [Allofranklinella schreckenbergeri]|uniref:hypothetical protein n=1 Tax=Allofranklinella schreckenbergeri TaxID=1076744 RepID=UPI001EEF1672|nr:hypothetical protein [Allofranklinella schreckenbergeri]